MNQPAYDDDIRRAWTIRGRVQGVGFRWWTRRTAEGLDVRGRVRNRMDGSVEVEAAGSEGAMEALEAALRRGPPSARVDEVVVREPAGELPDRGFEIAR